ncbi:MAG: MFS transporter, partial [Rhodobacteraceae bacterium]|nr:MFS transporter [Paracoccaceae bacterium]
FLQNLMGYPVVTVGLVLAPRGVGTMVAMAMVGRLVQRFDARYLVGVGVAAMAFSLWQMSQFTLDTSESMLIWSGVIQGMGMGFVFVPLSVVTFYTLSPRLRTEGASIYSLVRNIGSSVGVSVVVSFLSRAQQENHAILVEHLTPFSNAIEQSARSFDPLDPSMLPMLQLEVSRQAGILSYVQDFRFMTIATVCALPLLILLKPAPKIVAVRPQ